MGFISTFLGSLGGKLVAGVVGIAMVGGGVYYSLTKKDNFGEEFKRPPHAIEIFDENYKVPLIDEFEKEIPEKLTVRVELDEEKNILYFGNYTQDYNREDWSGTEKELLPVNERHTNINPVYSKIFILHPPKVKISKQEQRAFLVPQYKWDKNLKPYEEHEEAQMAIKGGEKIIDWALEQIPIPFFKDFIEEGIKNATEKEWKHYEELFEKTKAGYTATIIPSQIPNKILGYTETARESKIHFDMSKTEGEIPLYLWAKIALGDPSKASHGSFANKYGELENIVINFSLMGGKETGEKKIIAEEPQKLENYFFQGDELKSIKLFSGDIRDLQLQIFFFGYYGWNSNPTIIKKEELNKEDIKEKTDFPPNPLSFYKDEKKHIKMVINTLKKGFESDKIKETGYAVYIIPKRGYDSKEHRLQLIIQRFESEEDKENFIERGDYYPRFVNNNVMSEIYKPTFEKVSDLSGPFTEEQRIIYVNLIFDYMKRTGMEMILSKDEIENEKLLKGIKEFREK